MSSVHIEFILHIYFSSSLFLFFFVSLFLSFFVLLFLSFFCLFVSYALSLFLGQPVLVVFFLHFFISAYFSFYSLFILDEERVLLNGWDCSFSTNRDILPVLPVTNTNLRFHKAGEAPLFTSLIFTHTPNKSGCNTLFSYVSSKYRTLHRNGL